MIEILHRYNDKAVVYRAETATTLREAVRMAVASGADLAGADLAGAYLAGANLTGANLTGAKGVNPLRTSPLYLLREQPGPIRLYKLVTAAGIGPYNGGITYVVGESYEVAANTNETIQCGAGINVASLDWGLIYFSPLTLVRDSATMHGMEERK